MGRKLKRIDVDDCCPFSLDGVMLDDISAIIDDMKEIISAMGAIDGTAVFLYDYYGYDGGYELQVQFKRPETDKEYEARCKEQERYVAARKKADEKQRLKDEKDFARLKKKLGKQ